MSGFRKKSHRLMQWGTRVPFFFLLTLILWSATSQTIMVLASAEGLTNQQLQDLSYNPNWVGDCGASAYSINTDSSSDSAQNASGKNVYILGDSITARAQSQYESVLKDRGFSATIDGSSSRTITGKGTDGNKLSGLDAIDKDKADIEKASAIVVALGTNGDTTKDTIVKTVKALHSINKDANLYWIDTIAVDRNDNYNSTVIGPANKAIEGSKSDQNYSVISWFSRVDDKGDSQSPSKTERDPNNFIDTSDGLGVHPTPKGSGALAGLVADTLAGTGGANAADAGQAAASCCDSSTAQDAGATNTQATSADAKANALTIYNFLRGQGLSKPQAGGLLANLYSESGINPKRVQGPGLIEANEITVDNHTGYGLAQWTTSGRQQGLKDLAQGRNKSSSDLGVQIDYLWKELTTTYKGALSNLKKTTDYSSAIDVIINQFEAPRDRDQVAARGNAFKEIYDSLPDEGGSTSSSASSSGGGGSCGCPTGQADSVGKTVAIDPGHGPSKITIDAKTGLKQVESNNQPEGKNVWEVGQIAKKKLEADGYKVVMLKQSEDESATFRERASRADQANADIALSIHTDSSLGHSGEIYPQKVGLYRGSGDNKTTFTDSAVAEKSQKYADIFKSEREKAEGSGIVVKYNNFNGRPGYEPGDIQMVQLFSKTPWVYNEARSSDNDKYAKGLVDGAEKALGAASADGQASGAADCASDATGSGTINDIYATALKYAWPDYTNPNPTPKPAYKTASDKAKGKGEYTGGGYTDCGGFVTRLMRNSGADPQYNSEKLPTSGQLEQLKKDDKYQKLDAVTNVGQLKPGDIAVNDHHTYMYVGKNAGLKSQYDSVSASLAVSTPGRTPMASNSYDLGSWSWFRLKSLN